MAEFWLTHMGKKFFDADVPAFLSELKKLNQNLAALAPREVTVWVVEYTHRHGNDIWVKASEKEAWESVAAEIRDNLSEVQDEATQSKVMKLIADGDVRSAARMFSNALSEEFSVFDREVVLERVT